MPNSTAIQDSTQAAASLITTNDYNFAWFFFSNNLVDYIAVAIGFFIIFISYFFGGGKKNRVKIIISITLGVLIGMLTLPLLLKIAGDSKPGVVAFFVFLDILFTAAVTCHMYELVVIGTHEAFGPGSPMR